MAENEISSLEVGDIVLCTVDRIIGTNVFVRVHLNNKEIEGSIVTSEIAPGRIRNLRDYVVPKKDIVCKVLRISGDRIELSLRRVTQQEQKEVKESYKTEKNYENILKSVLGESFKETVKKIKEKDRLYDFLQNSKENSKQLEKLIGKENSNRIVEILNAQKSKKAIIKRDITLISDNPEGIILIKKILGEIKGIEIRYISAGRYSLRKESEDLKKSDSEMTEIIKEIERKAKTEKIEFSISKK